MDTSFSIPDISFTGSGGKTPELFCPRVVTSRERTNLVLALPPNKMVKEREWSFSIGASAAIQVAEFGPGSFECPDPGDQFKDWLKIRGGALERGDSGVYGARIKLHPALVEDQFFNLSVSGSRQPPPPRWNLPKSLRGSVPGEEGRGDSSDLRVFTNALSLALALPGCTFGPDLPCHGDIPHRHVPRTAARSHGRPVPATGSGSGMDTCQREGLHPKKAIE